MNTFQPVISSQREKFDMPEPLVKSVMRKYSILLAGHWNVSSQNMIQHDGKCQGASEHKTLNPCKLDRRLSDFTPGCQGDEKRGTCSGVL